jgi:L-lactate dehydrogenase (cytochrome)
MFKDKSYALELLQRAQIAKCPVLLLTVDLPCAGARFRYNRSRANSWISNCIDYLTHLKWWLDVRVKGGPLTIGNMPKSAPPQIGLSAMRKWMGSQLNLSASWNDFEWLRCHWKGKIVIKGILEHEDALLADKVGADGIIVSNHGGRHLDGTLSTINALIPIRDAIKSNMEILLDGGITTGLDIVKALALGANACMIGKSWVYGLAARGEQGVNDILTILENEIRIVMTHLGVSSIAEINKNLIHSATK